METEMKRMMKFGLALFFVVFVAPVWAHHAAEGIVSDEIWLMIDQNLEDAESPHLDMTLDDMMNAVMGSMDVGACPEGSNADMCLTTELVIYTFEADAYQEAIDMLYEDLANPQSAVNQIPSGQTTGERAAVLDYAIVDNLDDTSTVIFYEPIGSGVEDIDSDPPKSGARADN
jgi:hypothetical protein